MINFFKNKTTQQKTNKLNNTISPLLLLITITTLLHIKTISTQGTFPQFNGIGPTDSNVFTYQQNATKYYSIIGPLSNDADTQLTCMLVTTGDYALICITENGEVAYQFDDVTYYYINRPLVVYDFPSKNLIFTQEKNNIFFLISFNTLLGSTTYNLTVGNDLDQFHTLFGDPWNINSDSNVFYTLNKDMGNVINVYNISTGLLINSVTAPAQIMLMTISNNTILISPLGGSLSYLVYILTPITIEVICTFTNSFNFIYSDTTYYYLLNNGNDFNNPYSFSLFQFNTYCEPIWRYPLSYTYTPIVTYDLNLNYLYIWDDYNLTQINRNDVTDFNILKINEELPPYTYEYQYSFLGVDLNSNSFFWKPDEDQNYYFFQSFNSKLDRELNIILNPIPQSDLDMGLKISDISYPFGLTQNGVLFFIYTYTLYNDILEPKYFVGIQMEDSFTWRFLSIISLIVLIISFIVSIGLMIKHKVIGEDPSGWNKAKIPDLIGILVTSFALIVVSFAICYAQVDLVETINENTQMFTLPFSEFVAEYIVPCANPSIPLPNTVDLCTCYQYSSSIPFRDAGCLENACSNEINIACNSLLEESCDCADTLYQWTCNCDYNIDGTCSSNVTSSSTLNPTANQSWETCRHSFDIPSLILNISFYLVIVCAVIILILNFLQLLFKFDNPILDFIITVLSLFFAFIQFILLVIGSLYLGDKGCIEGVLENLPGCTLLYSASNNVISMENTARAYLGNAYLNLVSSPAMFIIAAIPDLLALFVCFKNRSEHLDALRSCLTCGRRRGFSSF